MCVEEFYQAQECSRGTPVTGQISYGLVHMKQPSVALVYKWQCRKRNIPQHLNLSMLLHYLRKLKFKCVANYTEFQ